MWLCPHGSETDATMPRTFDSSYHDMEVAEVLHCPSPGTCSGHEAVLGSGESNGGETATASSLLPMKMWLIQDFTLGTSEWLQ